MSFNVCLTFLSVPNEKFLLKESFIDVCTKTQLEPLSYRRMDFEEFCAATISPYQLEALDGWEQIASTAFEYFEREGNRVIFVKELAQVPPIIHTTVFRLCLIVSSIRM